MDLQNAKAFLDIKKRMSRLKHWFSTGCLTDANSEVLISVYVQKAMPVNGLSRHSRRILLTTSIWSAFLLVLVFIVAYTVLMLSVSRPFMTYRKRFTRRDPPNLRTLQNDSTLWFVTGLQHRKEIWNAELLYDVSEPMPKCEPNSLLIILITSSPDHFDHRRGIRSTWCNPDRVGHDISSSWQCVFLVGQVLKDTSLNEKIREESLIYKDVLRGIYNDSYRNLTHKVMHGLTWASTKCESRYVLKTDDDCFVNTHLLWQFLTLHNNQTKDLYTGSMVLNKNKRKVIRKLDEKWSVPIGDYLPEYYPVYASGSGYVLSQDVVRKAVEKSHVVNPIPNEDAYIGIVMDQLGIQPTSSGRFILSAVGLRLCNFMYVFVVHGIQPDMHADLLRKGMSAQEQCTDGEEITTWF